jgi:RimJ/RimL family protein N-acetyltransferase
MNILEYLNEEKIKEYIWLPESYEDFSKYIQKINAGEKTKRRTIKLKDSKKVIGSIVLRHISKKNKRVDLWYRIGKEHEWKWYMTEVLSEIISYLFKEESMERIQARVRCDNIWSTKLLEKNGFTCEWRARKYIKKGKVLYDFYLFGLLKDDIIHNVSQ